VIATGFEGEEYLAQAAAPLPLPQVVHQGSPAQAFPAPRRIERPAFIRRAATAREAMSDRVSTKTMMAAENEWDVPTFLRRQVD
jgi:hypothetical protein